MQREELLVDLHLLLRAERKRRLQQTIECLKKAVVEAFEKLKDYLAHLAELVNSNPQLKQFFNPEASDKFSQTPIRKPQNLVPLRYRDTPGIKGER